MVIKWKGSDETSAGEKWFAVWNRKKHALVPGMVAFSLLAALFLGGMVYAETANRGYNPVMTAGLLLASACCVICGSVLWYYQGDKKWEDQEYPVYEAKMLKICHRQEAVLAAYLLFAVVVLFAPREYDSYASDLITYDMGWIVFVVLGFLPLGAEAVNRIQFLLRFNPTREAFVNLRMICDKMDQGDLDIRNPFDEESEFYPFGKLFENIGHMTKNTVERHVKSEKLKVELITNVSHDLKTPLTSIISYIDLMEREELTEVLKDYTQVLSMKANKLKEMVESLFELAKTSSGNAELKIVPMDMNRLVEQVLADMKDSVDKSGRKIKLDLDEGKLVFSADSGAMYRICQNLFDNALKYSMEGTRIFIKTICEDGRVELIIINTAGYEMDFNEEEIVERFARGDQARTSEGNGLGLAIAKTYTEAMKGEFTVSIEGDQFKTRVLFGCSLS